MSIFIAQLFKKERGKQRLDERCTYLLPRQPKSSNWFSFKNSEIAIFYFNAALDRPPFIVNKSEIVLCHGYGEDGLEERVRRNFIDGKYLGLIDFPEAFCAVRVHDHGIEFAGSAVGADPLFYYENESVVVVTNRHNLLSLWVDSLTLRKEGVAWMIGRGHIGDFGTCWENICKTKPGAFYGFEKESSRIVESDYSSLFDPIDDGEIFKQVKEVSRCFRDILDKSESPCRFWLSGGKDSRAIAGLISEASRFPELTFQTHGEKFAPDVMAATSVARELGVLGRYTTSRSSLTEPTIDLTSALARDLLSDCTGGSLADFRTIPDSDLLIFGGHESGYKTPPNRLDLEAYLDSRKYWPDNQQILDRDFYNQLFAKFRNGLGALLASAPKSRYPQLEALVYVIGTRVTGAHSNSHVSRSEIHPFLDGRMVRLLFGVSDEALQFQFIHYAMMRQSASIIEDLPFAADQWPVGAFEFARKAGVPFRRPPQDPYRFMDFFPTQKRFGGYSWRLDLIQKTKTFVKSYIHDNQGFFDFLDLGRLDFLLEADTSTLNISGIYFRLSLLKACFTHYFSQSGSILKFQEEGAIRETIGDLVGEFNVEASRSSVSLADAFKEKLDDYENAIAKIAERDRVESARVSRVVDRNVADAVFRTYKSSELDLAKELKDLGYHLLPGDGVRLACCSSTQRVRGYLLNCSKRVNTVLIAIKGRLKEDPLIGFSWSDVGGFWFRYVNESGAENPVDIVLDLGELSAEVWLVPWYCKEQIYYTDFQFTGV